MPTETQTRSRSWREIWLSLLDRLPMSDHPLEPELSAEVFVHNEAGSNTKVTAPSSAPASDRPKSR